MQCLRMRKMRCKPRPIHFVDTPRKMAREVCSEEYEVKAASQVQNRASEDDLATQKEFDFVERPSEDFFCPVTFELLLNPHQTTCCGNHLSEKAVRRLQRDGKPCPVCKEPELSTVQDKFHRRRVSAVHVRCPYTPSGCEWAGEAGQADQHINSCTKRPWKCQYCAFESTHDRKVDHTQSCTHYPTPCPNKCDVETIPRCGVEEHLSVCPLELIECKFREAGCDVKVPRRDLKQHMEESQQYHLLSATLLNLKLTKKVIAEKEWQLASKEQLLTEKEKLIVEKEKQIAEMKQELAEKERQLAEKEEQLTEKDKTIKERDQQLLEFGAQLTKLAMETKISVDHLHKGKLTYFELTLEKFTECQKNGSAGDWYSEAFVCGGYKLKFNVETNIRPEVPVMPVYFLLQHGDQDDKLKWPVMFAVTIQLLNQLSDCNHHEELYQFQFSKRTAGPNYSKGLKFITYEQLLTSTTSVRYLNDDRLKFHLWMHVI